ncbi:MAG: hypothetical protein Ct9H300mP27_04560 [Chloroflexota bacterium]|nr:MAG: hypothetical protein Ct9H300mP27_04560 [Chloroflexota bacterium]
MDLALQTLGQAGTGAFSICGKKAEVLVYTIKLRPTLYKIMAWILLMQITNSGLTQTKTLRYSRSDAPRSRDKENPATNK